MLKLNTDCRHYRGEVPCSFGRLCEDCPHYEHWKSFVLVIKSAAMGDVLRTTSILPAVERRYPGAKITWLTGPDSVPLLRGNPHISEVVTFDELAIASLAPREFDLVICLDKTLPECGAASMMTAKQKKGVILCSHGTPVPADSDAEYYFRLGLDDELKFRENDRSYHELILEACGLDGPGGPPVLHLDENEKEAAHTALDKAGVGQGDRVGIVPGAGEVFANKTPRAEWWARFIRHFEKCAGPEGPEVVLLGGSGDVDAIDEVRRVAGRRPAVYGLDVRTYAAVLGMMRAIVCGDTLAMHIAIALEVPAAVLFGPTCQSEIDLFGRGVKIVTTKDCSPCYRRHCDESPDCMDDISPETTAERTLALATES